MTSEVLKAVVAITEEMSAEGISKSRDNKQQGYKFRGIDEVLNALSAKYAKHGLVVLPSYQNRQCVERKSNAGGALFNVTVEGTFRLVHKSGEDGSIVVGPFIGEAMDSADKATNKAMSAAYKYFALQTFAIPTEGDNDADATTHDVAPAASQQRAPQQREQRREASAQRPQGAVGGLTFPNYGQSAGQPVSGASVRDLKFYLVGAERGLEDPAKQRWRGQNQTLIDACRAELAKHEQPRGSDRITDPSEPDGYDGPGMGDDDIPFARFDVVFG